MNFVSPNKGRALGLSGQKGGCVEREDTEYACIAAVKYQGGDPNYPTTIRPSHPTFGVRQEGQILAPKRERVNKRRILSKIASKGSAPQGKVSIAKQVRTSPKETQDGVPKVSQYPELKSYKRTHKEKVCFFTILRNITLEKKQKPYENTYNILREIDSIEKYAQSPPNYSDKHDLYADDILSYLIEMGIDIIYGELSYNLIECTVHGFIGNKKVELLLQIYAILSKRLEDTTRKDQIPQPSTPPPPENKTELVFYD